MNTLEVKLKTVGDKVMFRAEARENPPITVDYFPPVGTEQGYTSLELLMASFGSCLGTSLLTLLRFRMKKTVEIQGVISLEKAMTELLSETRFDCVVHSMAVSDYVVRGLASEDGGAINNVNGKISSDFDSLVVLLDSAPKVISIVKKMQPDTVLVGFKLLSDVPERELLQAAQKQILVNGCDFVLANDLSSIESDSHNGMLIGLAGILERVATKQDIAKAIVRHAAGKATVMP